MHKNDIYWIAAVLDLRIKTRWIKKNIADATGIISKIKQFMKEMYLSTTEATEEVNSPSRDKKKGLEWEFLDEYATIDDTDDIDRWFDTLIVLYKPTKDESFANWLLKWWAVHKDEYFRMAAIARDYIAIPGAEVDVERLFNFGRDILGVRRWGILIDTFRALIIAKDGLRREKEG